MLLEICLLLIGILALLFDQFYSQEGFRAFWGAAAARPLPQIRFGYPQVFIPQPTEIAEGEMASEQDAAPENAPNYPNWAIARAHIRESLNQLSQVKRIHLRSQDPQALGYRLWLWLLGGMQFKENIREVYLRGAFPAMGSSSPAEKVSLWYVNRSWKGEVILLNESEQSVMISLADISENMQYLEQIYPGGEKDGPQALFREPKWEKSRIKGSFRLRSRAIARVSIFPFSSWEELQCLDPESSLDVEFKEKFWLIRWRTDHTDFHGQVQLYNSEDQCMWEDTIVVQKAGTYRLDLEARHIPAGTYRFSFREPGRYQSIWIKYP